MKLFFQFLTVAYFSLVLVSCGGDSNFETPKKTERIEK
jgi:hypothetical protein